jgi:membrane-associated protease RseP (regulator of RpoE activity)
MEIIFEIIYTVLLESWIESRKAKNKPVSKRTQKVISILIMVLGVLVIAVLLLLVGVLLERLGSILFSK